MNCDKKGFIAILRGDKPLEEIDWAAKLRESFAPFLDPQSTPLVCERPSWDCVECGYPTSSVVCPNCQHIQPWDQGNDPIAWPVSTDEG